MTTQENIRRYGEMMGITVDMQNDFALPSGSLSVKDAEETIDAVNDLNQFIRDNDGYVILTQDWHRPDNQKHFETWPPHCLQERSGAAIHQDVELCSADNIAKKGTSLEDDGYSGWEAEIRSGSLLERLKHIEPSNLTVGRAIGIVANQLAEREAKLALIIDGLATDYCVMATCLDALKETSRQTTDVYIVTDGVKAVNIKPDDGARALAKMIAAGAQPVTSEQLLDGSIVIDREMIE
ncbi:hypothetical protein CR969_00380 [Candidatus Saccharibacteria bacterium]|nr:MAG: hypothetical protein CR969_00380 [Candidatus Saccharibacteria bacterium]